MGGREIEPEAFAAAVERASAGVRAVDRTLGGKRAPNGEPERVTQFEALTAAAFLAFAAARVEVGVIEAGLGGRLDATNVLPSRVTALTSVSLEHTELLGDTEGAIAAEKLAVLREHSTLVLGRVSGEVAELARRTAGERSAAVIEAEPEPELPVRGAYQRRNFAIARGSVRALLGRTDRDAVRSVAASLELPGRLELVEGEPPLVLDAAHNPEGAAALVEALPEVSGGRPAVACLALLEGKDAAGVVRALVPALQAASCTEVPAGALAGVGRPGARSIPARELARLCLEAGLEAEFDADPRLAIERARARAAELSGVALVTGTHYLLRYARSSED